MTKKAGYELQIVGVELQISRGATFGAWGACKWVATSGECESAVSAALAYRDTSLIRNHPSLGPYRRLMSRALLWS